MLMEAEGSVPHAGWEGAGERMDFHNIFIASEVKSYTSRISNLPLSSKDQ